MTVTLENATFEVVGIVTVNKETADRVQTFASEWLTKLREKFPEYSHASVRQVRCDLKQMALTIGTATFARRFK